jgi:hypothetical protein
VEWRAVQDSNLWPSAPEALPADVHASAPRRNPLNLLPGGAAPVPSEVHADAGGGSVPAPAMPPAALPHAVRAALEALDARDVSEARRVLLAALRALDDGEGGT